jgi:hypothetical protein
MKEKEIYDSFLKWLIFLRESDSDTWRRQVVAKIIQIDRELKLMEKKYD